MKTKEPSFKSVFGISEKRGGGKLPKIASSKSNAKNDKHVASLYDLLIIIMDIFSC